MVNMWSNYDESGFINILKKLILYLVILFIFIIVVIMIFSEEVVSVVYVRGEFI